MPQIEIEIWYLIIGCSLLMLFFVAILIFILAIHQKRKFKTLKLEKETNEKEYLKTLQIQNEKIDLIMNERKRIAQDLHDGVGGLLAASKLLFSKTTIEIPFIVNQESYQKGLNCLNDAAIEIREISHNLLPKTLANSGLINALTEFVNTINQTDNIHIDFLNSNFKSRLNAENELIIYRIIQECINNIIKHAKAQNVLLHLIEKNDQLNISIEDDGNGFEDKNNYTGIGIKSIKERTALLNGICEIQSSENEGTTVLIIIPLN